MAALVAGGLLAAARTLNEATDVVRPAAIGIGRAAADSISKRGKSKVGDKTIFDALVPARDAMDEAGADPLTAGIAAARNGVKSTRTL